MTIHSRVCFHRRLFADRVRPHWCITGPVGPLGRTNQGWCGVKLLTMSVSTHPVGCVHVCHLLRGRHHSMHPNGSFCPPPACHPPPPPHPTRPPPIPLFPYSPIPLFPYSPIPLFPYSPIPLFPYSPIPLLT